MMAASLARNGRWLVNRVSDRNLSKLLRINSLVRSTNVQGARCIHLSNGRLKRMGAVGPRDPGMDHPKRVNFRESLIPIEWNVLIQRYPEFLPDPLAHNQVCVMRQIDDMLARRVVIDIPEFYVGSILAVTVSDQYSETKSSKFVGICINRGGQLLRADFTLRNFIDDMGIEIRYDLYNPLILSIEVLKLEKRLDESLFYLRDALPEYSTIPTDIKAIGIEPGAEIPINTLKVKMKPKPWTRRWEQYNLQGVEKLDDIPELWVQRMMDILDDPNYSYNTMLEYRRHCTEETMYGICKRLAQHEEEVVKGRNESKSKRFLKVDRKLTTLKSGAESKPESETPEEPADTTKS